MSWSDTTPAPTVAGTPPYLAPVRRAESCSDLPIRGKARSYHGSDEQMFGAKQQVLLAGKDD
jgi:hypothetical protein